MNKQKNKGNNKSNNICNNLSFSDCELAILRQAIDTAEEL